MGRQKILYISQEIAPYLPESPMAQFGRNLPQRMQEKGFEVRTFMPKYGCINERRNQLHEVIRLSGVNIVIDDTDHPLIIKVATLQPSRMQVYFIDNEDFFHHSPVKDLELVLSPDDNDERIMFFVRGVMETVKKLRWEPAIVHATGWVSALVPMYMRELYNDDPTFASSKIVYTLRPEDFSGNLDERFVEKLKLNDLSDKALASLLSKPRVDFVTLNKLAIDHSDAVVVTSKNIPAELVEYAEASGKPVLKRYDDEESFDSFTDFYNNLIG